MKSMGKKGELSGTVKGLVMAIVGIIVIFLIVGALSGDLTSSATNISGSGLPLASLFSPGGIVLLIFMVGIFLGVIGLALKKHHKG